MKNTAADTVEQSLVFCGREDGKLVALRQMVRVGLAAAAVAHLRPVRRAGDAALPRARVRRECLGRAPCGLRPSQNSMSFERWSGRARGPREVISIKSQFEFESVHLAA